jgi:hypothetical protein
VTGFVTSAVAGALADFISTLRGDIAADSLQMAAVNDP